MSERRDVELISIADAMQRFNLSRNALNGYIKSGLIKRYVREMGKTRIFVNARELERALQPKPDGPGEEE